MADGSRILDGVSFTVPLNEQSMVGYTVISGKSQLVDDAYDLPAGTPFGVQNTTNLLMPPVSAAHSPWRRAAAAACRR